MIKALSMYELNKVRYDRHGVKDWNEYRLRKRKQREEQGE